MKLSDLPEFKVKLKHVALAGVACIALYGVSYGMIEATNQTTFCGESCHEMDPMYQTWQHSAHAQSGVGCADCHEKPGLQGTIESARCRIPSRWPIRRIPTAIPAIRTRC